ncbi:MAG: ATP synthase F1 subunit gamma [Lachnospiraceae bacterium]|nr:ATP synthase F1 subunit gamma [Lachnospiraceae bacterium]
MASTKEIKDRMRSIQDTLKITNAMYMISSSKLKRAKKALAATEPYFFKLQSEVGRILRHVPDLKNIYFENRDEKEHITRGFIVITGDKGMAGAYNHNVLKCAEEKMKEVDNYKLYVLGELGRHYFEKHGIHIEEQFHYAVQKPTLNRARKIMESVIQEYIDGNLDEIYIVFTKMENAVTEEVQCEKLLPLHKSDYHIKVPAGTILENFKFQPSPEEVMDRLVPDYLVGFIYGALVESFSSEQNARMLAMQSASDSAKSMLADLDIQYNRARQAAITQEITEVSAGAKAQKRKKRR